ncbi:MAG TPA: hypothetical protein VFV78_07255 [Vicinamibacterales bacterium]|nr:hypothetical protein [Vicinamibacterales bacterium]
MAVSRKTVIWIIVGVVAFGVVCLIAVAGFGMYFVFHHVQAGPATPTEAFAAFDEARARFKEDKPIFDIDKTERPRQVREWSTIPTSTAKTSDVRVLAWNPDRERLARVSIPLWVLPYLKGKVDISSSGFDFERLRLDADELRRVGPVLLFDFSTPSGVRVLIWTQ